MSDTAPIALGLRATNADTVVGEGVVLALDVTALAPAVLESPDLNDDRTRIEVERASDRCVFELDGAAHRALHRPRGDAPLGQTFSVDAATAWTVDLELLKYTRAPAAGEYTVRVRYRYGDTEREALATNAVTVRVHPAWQRGVSSRWFAMADARDELGLIREVDTAVGRRWIYHVARRHDPSASITASDIGRIPDEALSFPALARLDDISAGHFEKVLVWDAPGGIGWKTVQARGEVRAPALAPHGLGAGDARLVEPPLQLRRGGFAAVMTGRDALGRAVAVALEVRSDREPRRDVIPLDGRSPEHAVVAWRERGDRAEATLWWAGRDHDGSSVMWRTEPGTGGSVEVWRSRDVAVRGLFLDAWRGGERVMALCTRGPTLEVLGWDTHRGEASAHALGSWDLEREGVSPEALIQSAPRHAGRSLVTLFRGDGQWVVLSPSGVVRVPFEAAPSSGAPLLVVNARDRAFLLCDHPDYGLVSVPL